MINEYEQRLANLRTQEVVRIPPGLGHDETVTYINLVIENLSKFLNGLEYKKEEKSYAARASATACRASSLLMPRCCATVSSMIHRIA